MTAIEPENASTFGQRLEVPEIEALIADLVDLTAGTVRVIRTVAANRDELREARQAKRTACTILGDLLGYIDLKAPGTDPDITDGIVRALSVLEGIAE